MEQDGQLRQQEQELVSRTKTDESAGALSVEEPESAGFPQAEAPEQHPAPAFTVAGIGASAGGLEALRGFLELLPVDTGIGFVVVHLSPEHQSHLAELLQAHTEMPVTQATELVKMEPNHVYVIPPNRNLSSIDTHLRLSPLEDARRERAPIDHFFRTLARSHASKAIGIVLSGGGSDGAVGLKAIKEAGGLILAQDPAEAAYDSMPQSAIAAGIVDDVLPASQMAERMLAHISPQPIFPALEDEAEEALRESEERFRALVNASAQIVWTTDATGQVVEDSPSWRAFTGQTLEEWRGDGWSGAVHPEDRAYALAQWQQAVEMEAPLNVEFRLQHVGSEWRWVHTRAVPLYDKADEVRGWVGMNTDITERKEAEEALRQSEERLRRIFEIATVGVIFFDEQGTLIEANDTFLQILGYTRRELEAGELSWQKLTPPEWMDLSYQQIAQMEETGRIGPYEKEYYRKDGSRWWLLFAGVQLDNGDIFEFVLDINEQKVVEQALRKSQEDLKALTAMLEERVEARTAQVRQLASELVASEQTVRQRISQTLHDDLQQLLYAAQAQLHLARGNPAGIEEVVQLVDRAITLTRQLTVEMSPPVLEGEGLAEALRWLANHMDEAYGLQVTVKIGDRYQMLGQEQRILLFQIVRELLFNVVKHAGVDEAEVRVAGTAAGLKVSVLDHGRGFDVQQVMEEEDNGFGLHSVRERIALFDGRLQIDSELGEGTRVTLFLSNTVLGRAAEEK